MQQGKRPRNPQRMENVTLYMGTISFIWKNETWKILQAKFNTEIYQDEEIIWQT